MRIPTSSGQVDDITNCDATMRCDGLVDKHTWLRCRVLCFVFSLFRIDLLRLAPYDPQRPDMTINLCRRGMTFQLDRRFQLMALNFADRTEPCFLA